jgi:hypothetical protein
MTLQQCARDLEKFEEEADALAIFFASLKTSRLRLIVRVLGDELSLRCEGKPDDRSKLH